MSFLSGRHRLLWAGLSMLLAAVFITVTSAQEAPSPLPFGHKHLIAASTFRILDRTGAAYDVVILGRYDFLDDKTCQYTYFTYDARRNAPATETAVHHPRVTAEARGAPGPFRLPTYSAFQTIRGTWLLADDTLRVRIGDVLHDWVRKDAEGLFVPAQPYINAVDGSHVIAGQTFSNARGYAYLSNYANLPRRITRADLLPVYNGEIHMLLHQRGRESRWISKPSGFNQQRYSVHADGDLLSYHGTSTLIKPPMKVFSDFLLNQSTYSKLLLYSAGGHDFNRNGVYDELGHTLQMYGIYDGKRIARMVFVEHSYQTSGSPLLAVGHYYGTSAPLSTPPPTPPGVDDGLIPPLPKLRPR